MIKKYIHKLLESLFKKDFDLKKKEIIERLYQLELEKKRTEEEVSYQKEIKDKKLKEFERELSETRLRFEKTNNELKEQIKLLEAKASPNNVWVEAFGSGFNNAFNLINDFIKKGTSNIEGFLKDKIYSEAMSDINSIMEEKITSMNNISLVDKYIIIQKKEDIENKLKKAQELKNDNLVFKYQNYLDVLNWIIKGEPNDNRDTK